MTCIGSLERLLSERDLLLATVEQLAKSMNGASARRVAQILDDLSVDPTGRFLVDEDRDWISGGLAAAEASGRQRHWSAELDRLAQDGVRVLATVDSDYPTNLQLIHDRPPLLFVRGELDPRDRRAVAIVGTRQCTERGQKVATTIATGAAQAGITVVSGLAKGIDTAAHHAAVKAGGRTIAVFGTAIDRVYPATNRSLAEQIVATGGALVSQFLPGVATGRWSFPVRNVTMSGLAAGTIVVEAGETSGARIQAEAAVAHGKRLFLVESLVTSQPWALEMSTLPGVTVASGIDDILSQVEQLVASPGEDAML